MSTSTDFHRLIALWGKDLITAGEFEIALTEAAGMGASPEEMAASIPTEILNKIRAKASAPPDAKWQMFAISTGDPSSTPEERKDYKEQQEQQLREGLNRWRAYFESSAK